MCILVGTLRVNEIICTLEKKKKKKHHTIGFLRQPAHLEIIKLSRLSLFIRITWGQCYTPPHLYISTENCASLLHAERQQIIS